MAIQNTALLSIVLSYFFSLNPPNLLVFSMKPVSVEYSYKFVVFMYASFWYNQKVNEKTFCFFWGFYYKIHTYIHTTLQVVIIIIIIIIIIIMTLEI